MFLSTSLLSEMGLDAQFLPQDAGDCGPQSQALLYKLPWSLLNETWGTGGLGPPD